MTSWQKQEEIKAEVVKQRQTGTTLKRIMGFIKSKGFNASEPELSLFFTANNIVPIFKELIKDTKDLKALEENKKTVKMCLDAFRLKIKEQKKAGNLDIKLVDNFLKVNEKYIKLANTTLKIAEFDARLEAELTKLRRIILGAEEKYPGINAYVQEKLHEVE